MKAKTLAATALGILALYTSLSVVGTMFAMAIPRLPLEGSPAAVGLNYEDVFFYSRSDSVLLRGWYIAGRGERVIAVVHGGFQNRVDAKVGTLELARDLVGRGYDMLLFDLRGRGDSEGRGRALSYVENDIGGAVDWLKNKGYPSHSIALMGFCSGAVSSLTYARTEEVGALVLEGCFPTVDGMVIRQATEIGIPRFLVSLFIPGMTLAARLLYGYEAVQYVSVVSEVSCPILFIYGEHDNLVSLGEALRLLSASKNRDSEIWRVGSAEHSEAYRVNPIAFVEKVDGFLSDALKGRTRDQPGR